MRTEGEAIQKVRHTDKTGLLRYICNDEILEIYDKNDLESAAIAKLPIIGEILTSLQSTQGCFMARMSVSGATCFGLYHDELSAKSAAYKLQKTYPQAWCMNTHIVHVITS